MKKLLLALALVFAVLQGCGEPNEPPTITLIDALDVYAFTMQGSLIAYELGDLGADEQRAVDIYSAGTWAFLANRYYQEHTPGNVLLEAAYKRASASRDAWAARENK